MKHLLTTFFFLTGILASAQQEIFFNQFWNNQTHFNPAFAGMEYQMQAGALYRNQWSNVNGAPNDLYAFYNTRLKKDWGIGANLNSGTIGLSRTFNLAIPASYRIQIKDDHTLALGAAVALHHHTVTVDLLPPESIEDPSIVHGNQQYLSAHGGIAYDNRLLTGSISVRTLPITQLSGGYGYQPVAHYYGMLRLKLNGDILPRTAKIYLEANYGTDLVFSALQLNARLFYDKRLSVVGGYVWNNGLLYGAGWDLYEKFRLTYAGTWVQNDITSDSFTHELSFVYQLPLSD